MEMATKNNLVDWVTKALEKHNGSASIAHICKYIWENYEQDLRASGELFYTWQYDMRWAGVQLRNSGVIKPTAVSPKGGMGSPTH